jgi:hypothetical protein
MSDLERKRPIPKSWIKRDWEHFKASAISTKAQTLSALVSAAALVIIAAQYVDTHRIVAITQRQMFITAHSDQSGLPNIAAFTASGTFPMTASSHDAIFTIGLRNIGSATADDVDVETAPDFSLPPHKTFVEHWENVVPGEPIEMNFSTPVPYLKNGTEITVHVSYRRPQDGPTVAKQLTCTRFRFSESANIFEVAPKCD